MVPLVDVTTVGADAKDVFGTNNDVNNGSSNLLPVTTEVGVDGILVGRNSHKDVLVGAKLEARAANLMPVVAVKLVNIMTVCFVLKKTHTKIINELEEKQKDKKQKAIWCWFLDLRVRVDSEEVLATTNEVLEVLTDLLPGLTRASPAVDVVCVGGDTIDTLASDGQLLMADGSTNLVPLA